MEIDLQSRDLIVTYSLREHVNKRLKFALSTFNEYILKVIVRLSDINGPKGGIDQHCHLQVVLIGMPDVVIEDTEENLYVAVVSAAQRANQAVVRKIKRHKSRCIKNKAANIKAQLLL